MVDARLIGAQVLYVKMCILHNLHYFLRTKATIMAFEAKGVASEKKSEIVGLSRD